MNSFGELSRLGQFQHTAARRRLVTWTLHGFRHGCFNTQPPEGGCSMTVKLISMHLPFQHTAARRRLWMAKTKRKIDNGFNTQPPEGGCTTTQRHDLAGYMFQHTAARRRLDEGLMGAAACIVSTHSRPKAAVDDALNPVGIIGFQHTAARRRLSMTP